MKRTLLLLAAVGSGWCWTEYLHAQQVVPPNPAPVVAAPGAPGAPGAFEEQFEPLTRGPVHEAFAQAATSTTAEGFVVKKEPPSLIDEIPPAHRPTGDDIAWIPGYWGWDDERNDFIWISGIWRAIPPGRIWVPGYWARVAAGNQWVSGYWADMKDPEVEYLPAPPETAEAGPSVQSPTGNEIWIPGCWVFQVNKFVWRTGYWAKGDPRWVWTNSHYVNTPRGYIYVSGYWDFLPEQRGVLYAPVYFTGPVAQNYVYSPRLVVNSGLLQDHLFLRPTYGHYYYGDYYAGSYRNQGILPYYVFNNNRYGYDSLYSYQLWNHRNDRNWAQNTATRYDDLRDREAGRPPRDYATWQKRNVATDRNPFFSGIQDYGRGAGSTWKFRDLGDDGRRDVGRMSRELDTYRQQRIKAEAEAAATARTGENRAADRIRLLKPPIGGTSQQVGRDTLRGEDPLRAGQDNRPRLEREPPVPPRDLTPETPKVTPRETPRVETPRVETSKPVTPRVDTPKPVAPKPETPKVEPLKPTPLPMPRPEPRPQPQPKVERPERPAPGTPGKEPGPGAGPGRPQGGDRPNKGKKD